MDTLKLLRAQKDTISVPELRSMLGIKKTESYWILKHRNIKTVTVNGHIRILKSSFYEWYQNQVKYRIINGPEPGEKLREISFSPQELAEILEVSDDTVYALIAKGAFEVFMVDTWMRITKESFNRWYSEQEKYRIPADREKANEIIASSYSLTDIARMLGVHRNTIYGIVNNDKYHDVIEIVTVCGHRRITVSSFEKWYNSQTKYQLHQNNTVEEFPILNEYEQSVEKEEHVPEISINSDKSLYRIDDLIAATGISRKSAYSLIQSGEIIAVKAGKSYYIPAAEYKRYLEGGL